MMTIESKGIYFGLMTFTLGLCLEFLITKAPSMQKIWWERGDRETIKILSFQHPQRSTVDIWVFVLSIFLYMPTNFH